MTDPDNDGPPPPPTAGGPDGLRLPGLGGDWQRLHPLSPLVRAGRGAIPLVVVVAIPVLGNQHRSSSDNLIQIAIVAVVLGLGVVSWLVTRWRVADGVLRVESGLIRRTSERFPLSQIQAIDTVRPGLARVFGLAELRIRLAGGSGRAGRLAYLSGPEAERLRARLLALSHGLAEATPAPPERPLLAVAPGRLAVSILLSGAGLTLALVVGALVLLTALAPNALAAVLSGGAAPLIGVAFGITRRFNLEYGLTVAEAPDGLRLRSGLVQISAETIPDGRIQAIRMVEPLAWRPFGGVASRSTSPDRSPGAARIATRPAPGGPCSRSGAGKMAPSSSAVSSPTSRPDAPPHRPGRGGSRRCASASSRGRPTTATRSPRAGACVG